ncbi:hypothetical protein VPH35_067735 [Triticum aestivum]|uniref:SHSP domain-containing protein n=2 Tax=Triticum TaxID=4564 RepID=A0A3B6HZF0_WHEAT
MHLHGKRRPASLSTTTTITASIRSFIGFVVWEVEKEVPAAAMDRAINRTYEEYTPVVEWSHSADASFVKIIVPGFKREEIRVLVDNHGHLRTRGERPVEGGRWSRFQKDLQLPSDCNVDGIRAKFENEALTITLPKKHPSPPQQQAAPVAPVMPMPAPAPATPKPEPRRPYAAPSQKPPPALPEPARPAATAPPPVVPSQNPFADRRPSLARKPADIPAPVRPAPPVPEPESPKRHNGAAATARPELPAFPKPTGEWVREEAKKPQEEAMAAEEEEKRRMEREARGKMEEDRKMAEADKETERMMDMARRRRAAPANRGLLLNVAVAALVLVGITVYVWRNLSAAASGGGDAGAGSYGDEM